MRSGEFNWPAAKEAGSASDESVRSRSLRVVGRRQFPLHPTDAANTSLQRFFLLAAEIGIVSERVIASASVTLLSVIIRFE